MSKQLAPVDINSFSKGLVTDAGPLNFPADASIAEDNMILSIDGGRNRRFGMDFEENHSTILTDVNFTHTQTFGQSSFRWENAGGIAEQAILVVQFGEEIKFFGMNESPLSGGLIHTEKFGVESREIYFSYAVVDGILLVVNGEKTIKAFIFDSDANTIAFTEGTLQIRDLFGVEDIIDDKNLRVGNFLSTRPKTSTSAHLYNARNQTFGVPRRAANTESDLDPYTYFFAQNSEYPSNSDAVTHAWYEDPGDEDNRTIKRFFPKDLKSNPIGNFQSPTGHYIIDALDRGVSRLNAAEDSVDKYKPVVLESVIELPEDITPGGATIVSQYAGRAFYAGFSGEVINGDTKSPRLSSYILFSKTVEEITDTTRCHQGGDPTSTSIPDLLATDGGFIRLDEAYAIRGMVSMEGSLFIFAQNGVWRISGEDRGQFGADSYKVEKISDRGCVGTKSIIEAEGTLAFWGDDGIYVVERNEFGDWLINSITTARIQLLYNDIDSTDKFNVQGYYDTYDKKLRWIYHLNLDSLEPVRELVLDKTLGAFYTNTIFTPIQDNNPRVVGIFETNPFRVNPSANEVQVNGEQVQVDEEDVEVTLALRTSSTRSIGYIATTSIASNIIYTFALYKDRDFLDWKTFDGNGVDAAAFTITGYDAQGTLISRKQVPYINLYMRKTEEGFTPDPQSGDWNPVNTSSVIVQSQWDWTNSENSKRWGKPFQGYRQTRVYWPSNIADDYEDGHSVVVTRNKLRGRGRVLSLKFSTEPGKDFHLYGWSMLVSVSTGI